MSTPIHDAMTSDHGDPAVPAAEVEDRVARLRADIAAAFAHPDAPVADDAREA